MLGYKFYLQHAEAKDKGTCKNTGNCIAVNPINNACLYTAGFTPNSRIFDWIEINPKNLEAYTEIEEGEAKIHHPNLFSFLGVNI